MQDIYTVQWRCVNIAMGQLFLHLISLEQSQWPLWVLNTRRCIMICISWSKVYTKPQGLILSYFLFCVLCLCSGDAKHYSKCWVFQLPFAEKEEGRDRFIMSQKSKQFSFLIEVIFAKILQISCLLFSFYIFVWFSIASSAIIGFLCFILHEEVSLLVGFLGREEAILVMQQVFLC